MVDHVPNGEQCLQCHFKKVDCSALDFDKMKVIKKEKEYNIVMCNNYQKEDEVMDGQNLTINDYQATVMKFRLESANAQYAILGLQGEAGEVASLAAKAIRDGKQHDYEHNIKKELGDVLWFIAAIAADNGYALQDIAESNIRKLTDRSVRGVLQGSGDNR